MVVFLILYLLPHYLLDLSATISLQGYLKTAQRKGPLPEETVWSLFIQVSKG